MVGDGVLEEMEHAAEFFFQLEHHLRQQEIPFRKHQGLWIVSQLRTVYPRMYIVGDLARNLRGHCDIPSLSYTRDLPVAALMYRERETRTIGTVSGLRGPDPKSLLRVRGAFREVPRGTGIAELVEAYRRGRVDA